MTDSNPPDDDPFAEFEDWLIDGPAGRWPLSGRYVIGEDPRSDVQRTIVEANAYSFLDSRLWIEKVDRFEIAVSSLSSSDQRSVFRSRYKIHFDGHEFGNGYKSFHSRLFPCSVSFNGTRFGDGDVDFFRSKFAHGSITFRHAQVGSGEISFFLCDMDLDWISFVDADFSRAQFDFTAARVRGPFAANDLKAKGAKFNYSSFENVANIDHIELDRIPDFRQSQFSRPPDVSRILFPEPGLRVNSLLDWRQTSATKRYFFLFSTAVNKDDVQKLRKLKAMALAANDHEKDGEFFAYEMMAKRGVEHTTFWQLLFNTIYLKVSFYGQSYLRPLAWLGASFATFAAIYSLMAALPTGGWQSLAFGITYSFKNSLPFLGTLTRSVPSPDGHTSWFAFQLQAIKDAQPGPDWFTVLGTGQAMLSLFFFFFLLLGLRNKFRLK